MPSSWHPEALRAQAIAGRTYATRKVQAGIQAACGCHLGATPADQVYAGWAKEGEPTFGIKWVDAVRNHQRLRRRRRQPLLPHRDGLPRPDGHLPDRRLRPPCAGGGQFTDTAGSVHAGAIDAVAGAGITSG
jgi:hypothetical protein